MARSLIAIVAIAGSGVLISACGTASISATAITSKCEKSTNPLFAKTSPLVVDTHMSSGFAYFRSGGRSGICLVTGGGYVFEGPQLQRPFTSTVQEIIARPLTPGGVFVLVRTTSIVSTLKLMAKVSGDVQRFSKGYFVIWFPSRFVSRFNAVVGTQSTLGELIGLSSHGKVVGSQPLLACGGTPTKPWAIFC